MCTTARGHVHAPFFVFVRQRGLLSDGELLARLDLTDHRSRDYIDDRDGWVIGLWMTNDPEWTHIIDNWLYDLYNEPGIRERIAKLGAEYDVFTCAFGFFLRLRRSRTIVLDATAERVRRRTTMLCSPVSDSISGE